MSKASADIPTRLLCQPEFWGGIPGDEARLPAGGGLADIPHERQASLLVIAARLWWSPVASGTTMATVDRVAD